MCAELAQRSWVPLAPHAIRDRIRGSHDVSKFFLCSVFAHPKQQLSYTHRSARDVPAMWAHEFSHTHRTRTYTRTHTHL